MCNTFLSGAKKPVSLLFDQKRGGVAQWIGCLISDQGVPGSIPRRCTFRCGLEQVTITLCLVLVKPRKRWTDDRLGQTVTRLEITPNVLSPRDLVSRPDIMDETVPHTLFDQATYFLTFTHNKQGICNKTLAV